MVSQIQIPMMSRTVSSRVDELESSVRLVQTEIRIVRSEIGSMKEDMQKMMKQLELFVGKSIDSPWNSTNPVIAFQNEKSAVRNVGNDGEINRFSAIKERKLDLPSFDGKDPDDWILRAEHCFALNRLTNEERLEVAVVAFEGDAIRWFQWEIKRSPMIQWEEMKLRLLNHFRTTTACSYEQFLSLKQEGTVADYRRKYVNLAAPLEGISEEVFLGQFMKGLQPMIKAEMRLFSPTNVSDAMDLASKIEDKNKILKTAGNWFNDQEEEDDQLVISYLRFPANFDNEKGIHIHELEQKLKLSHAKIRESIRKLEDEGKIYATIDLFHYKAVSSS